MPTARESLLNAAAQAVERRPWPVVRMIEVAAAAGVSRQTLYNEFGDKAGLGSALAEHRTAVFLDGFQAFLRARRHDPAALSAATGWIVRTARADRVVHAALTGCRCAGLPPHARAPGQLVGELCACAVRTLGEGADLDAARTCETAVRLAISHLVAPPAAAPAAAGA
ncbi:TetR/AcrR family transcriptional regulator [Streptomyces johnsoniae]|uniref:TetR/AcrR family transcriptional regulator n=1 Tax=Streptomyces johnsoniae TaxID=3075532 RepID=A0ABU2S2L8_9ACTN|nr:TetR/AcrR family transcriptional regulator [Streptomyces sp. DSM 41886]MDT0443243.1 TetR/AcrR family transcriptional regulator [Streptomyces sp. DSM 41886]